MHALDGPDKAALTPTEAEAPQPRPDAAIRVVSTMTGAGYWWSGWCEYPGCNWKGPTRRGGLGGRQLAEHDVQTHVDTAHPA